MAKEIKYKVEGILCKEKCPHTGNYIGSIVCWYCQYNERRLTKEQVFDGERIVYCNHPKWVDDL